MRVIGLWLKDFRCYERAEVTLGERLTVVWGPNGAGKSNLLEALYVGATARSPRTGNDRELVRFGAPGAQVLLATAAEDGRHELSVGLVPGEGKRARVDGVPVERLLDCAQRPLVSVFMPDRLELIKGPPALRRAHLDRFLAALWPARAGLRRAYAQALAQRNALLGRVRSGVGSRAGLGAWDQQLARLGIALMGERARAVEEIAERFCAMCSRLGIEGGGELVYRPRSRASTAEQLAAELAERVELDLERGFTGHGPHRDELLISQSGRELRIYGSQGQQRLALLALLLAEREALANWRGTPPLMLLDDVMSELDAARRAALVQVLDEAGGQAVIATTDIDQVPGGEAAGVARLAVRGGSVIGEARAA